MRLELQGLREVAEARSSLIVDCSGQNMPTPAAKLTEPVARRELSQK